MTASLLRPFYRVTNRCTDVAPVLGRGTDLEEVINNRTHMYVRTLILLMQELKAVFIVGKSNLTTTKYTKTELVALHFLCKRLKVNTDVWTSIIHIFDKLFLNTEH